jgi:deoxyribonuclease-1
MKNMLMIGLSLCLLAGCEQQLDTMLTAVEDAVKEQQKQAEQEKQKKRNKQPSKPYKEKLVVRKVDRDRNYNLTRKVFWKELYPRGGYSLYCRQEFDGGYQTEVNVEHVFPMSWVMKELRCGDRNQCRRTSQRFNFIESDLHNMFPALQEVNKVRSAMPFGIIKGEKFLRLDAALNCDFEVDFHKRRVEPTPAARGEIARALLYMDDSYPELELFKRQRDMLIQWNKADRPSNAEKKRNDMIEKLQGVRNHWVDE